MTHTIEITGVPDEMLKRLDSRARERHAADRSEYVRELIARDLSSGPLEAPRERQEQSLAEILAPIHEAVSASGMTSVEVNALIDETLHEVRREKRQKRENIGQPAHE